MYTDAALRIWTGDGWNSYWTNPNNWGGIAPSPGDDLRFTGYNQTVNINDFPNGTQFSSITLSGTLAETTDFTLRGNDVVLTGGDNAVVNRAGTGGIDGYTLTIEFNITFDRRAPSIILDKTTRNNIVFKGNINNNGYDITIYSHGNKTNIWFDGVVSGSGSLIKTGTGMILFRGANTYTGKTILNSGGIRLTTEQSLGSGGDIIINGGEFNAYPEEAPVDVFLSDHTMIWNENFGLQGKANVSLGNGNVVMTKDITINVNDGICLTIGGNISGNYNINKTGKGTLLFEGNSTYGGTTTVCAGTMKLGSSSCLGNVANGTIVRAEAVLDLNGQDYTSQESLTIHTTDEGAIINSNTTPGSYHGTILLGDHSFINATVGNITIADNGSSITGNGYNLKLGGVADGVINRKIATYTATLTKVHPGTWTIAKQCMYTEGTIIREGVLILGDSNILPDSGNVTVDGLLNLNSFDETVGSITGSGSIDNLTGSGNPTFTFGVDNTTTVFAGVITNTTGIVNITKSGTGTIYLDGHNTYSGKTFIEDGFLEIKNGSIVSF